MNKRGLPSEQRRDESRDLAKRGTGAKRPVDRLHSKATIAGTIAAAAASAVTIGLIGGVSSSAEAGSSTNSTPTTGTTTAPSTSTSSSSDDSNSGSGISNPDQGTTAQGGSNGS